MEPDREEERKPWEWEDDEVIKPGPDWPGWHDGAGLEGKSPEEIDQWIEAGFEQAEREAAEEEGMDVDQGG